MSVVYYVPTDDDELLISTTDERAKARAVERDPKVSLCVVDERWPFAYLQVYADATVDRDPTLVVDLLMAVAGRLSGEPSARMPARSSRRWQPTSTGWHCVAGRTRRSPNRGARRATETRRVVGGASRPVGRTSTPSSTRVAEPNRHPPSRSSTGECSPVASTPGAVGQSGGSAHRPGGCRRPIVPAPGCGEPMAWTRRRAADPGSPLHRRTRARPPCRTRPRRQVSSIRSRPCQGGPFVMETTPSMPCRSHRGSAAPVRRRTGRGCWRPPARRGRCAYTVRVAEPEIDGLGHRTRHIGQHRVDRPQLGVAVLA